LQPIVHIGVKQLLLDLSELLVDLLVSETTFLGASRGSGAHHRGQPRFHVEVAERREENGGPSVQVLSSSTFQDIHKTRQDVSSPPKTSARPIQDHAGRGK